MSGLLNEPTDDEGERILPQPGRRAISAAATTEDYAWREFCLLQISWITIWQSYMRWFSWHFGIHVFALGYVIATTAFRQYTLAAAVFMGGFGLLGTIAAVCMAAYDHGVRRRANVLRDESLGNSYIFGRAILNFAPWATVVSNLFILAAWTYVAVIADVPPAQNSPSSPTSVLSPR